MIRVHLLGLVIISCLAMGFSYKKTIVRDLSTLKPGSHIRVVRLSTSSNEHGYYDHHMLLIKPLPQTNELHVIHYSQTGGEGLGSLNSFGFGGRDRAATEVIEETVFISKDNQIELLEYADDVKCFSAQESIQRARDRLKESKYNLLTNNCECFVNWAITDEATSNQVQGGLVHTAAGFLSGALRGFREGGLWSSALKEGASGAASGYTQFREKRH